MAKITINTKSHAAHEKYSDQTIDDVLERAKDSCLNRAARKVLRETIYRHFFLADDEEYSYSEELWGQFKEFLKFRYCKI